MISTAIENALPSQEGRFSFHVWLDGCVVFDHATGDTHILDVFSAQEFLLATKVPQNELDKLRIPQQPPEILAVASEEALRRLESLNLPCRRAH